MTLKIGKIILISLLTTVVSLIVTLNSLGNNSGYFGLFILFASPAILFLFFIWTIVVTSIFKKETVYKKSILIFIFTIIFEYVIVLLGLVGLSSDRKSYNLVEFLDDSSEIFSYRKLFFCLLVIAVFYTCCLFFRAHSTTVKKQIIIIKNNDIVNKKV